MHESGQEEYGTAEEMERAAAEWAERERKVDHVAAALQAPATPATKRLDLRQYAKQLATEMKESGSRSRAYQSTDEDDSDTQDVMMMRSMRVKRTQMGTVWGGILTMWQ